MAQLFAPHHLPLPLADQGCGVEQTRVLAIGSPFHKADKHPEFCIQLGQFPAELVHHLLLFVHPRSIRQKVARRVAPDRQFRRHHQIGLLVDGLPAGLEDALGIAAEVTNQGIDLARAMRMNLQRAAGSDVALKP